MRSLIFIVIAAQNQNFMVVRCCSGDVILDHDNPSPTLSVCLSVCGGKPVFGPYKTVFEARTTVLTLNILWLIVGQLFHNNCRKGD